MLTRFLFFFFLHIKNVVNFLPNFLHTPNYFFSSKLKLKIVLLFDDVTKLSAQRRSLIDKYVLMF